MGDNATFYCFPNRVCDYKGYQNQSYHVFPFSRSHLGQSVHETPISAFPASSLGKTFIPCSIFLIIPLEPILLTMKASIISILLGTLFRELRWVIVGEDEGCDKIKLWLTGKVGMQLSLAISLVRDKEVDGSITSSLLFLKIQCTGA